MAIPLGKTFWLSPTPPSLWQPELPLPVSVSWGRVSGQPPTQSEGAGPPNTPTPYHHRKKLSNAVKTSRGAQKKARGSFASWCSRYFFLFCRTTNILARFVSPGGGWSPQPQEQSCPGLAVSCLDHICPTHADQRYRHHLHKEREICQRQPHSLSLFLTVS